MKVFPAPLWLRWKIPQLVSAKKIRMLSHYSMRYNSSLEIGYEEYSTTNSSQLVR